MKQILSLFLFLGSMQLVNAQEPAAPLVKEKWHFGKQQDTASGYAQVVKVGNVLYVSGTVASELTAEGVRKLYTNLEKSLQHFGATFQHVVKENLYTLDIDAMKKLNDVRKSFYKGDFPAATWVQVNRLYMPELKLEIELVAYLK
ncbi:MAG: RidA family protein [Sphingobacteriales bacterium]|nr:MAG: RidA family protein [Sphingobacteriales bacterium]